MSRSDARCATPYIYSGELQIRPEVDAALAALKDKPYTAIPSWKNDGTWELWTVEGDGETEPCIISGPSTTYASEADVLNVALFGITAKQWREKNPDKNGNLRDYATLNQLLVLANMESYNAILIEQGKPQPERLQLLNKLAIRQLKKIEEINVDTIKKLGK